MSLKTKLQLSFLSFGLLCVALTGWQPFEYARSSLASLTFDRLTSIRDTKKRQTETYFRQSHDRAPSQTLPAEKGPSHLTLAKGIHP